MTLLEQAEHFSKHEFDILGSGWVRCFYGMSGAGFEGKNYFAPWSVEQAKAEIPAFYRRTSDAFLAKLPAGYEPIDWQIDMKSGARFTAAVHHSKLAYGVIEGVDAKVSADLGRLYQLPVLARAYRATGEKRFFTEMTAQLYDFLAFNAPEYGAAWRANMNVSIRAANILTAADLSGLEIAGDLLDAVKAHGKFIVENLEFPETSFHPNHFIANLSGLLMCAVAVNNCEWLDYAAKAMDEQTIAQSYADGCNFEGATSYHCFVVEMLLRSICYTAKQEKLEPLEWMKKHLSEASIARFYMMLEAIRDITMPNGEIPIIGDNDSGRFLLLENNSDSKTDFRFLLEQGASVFGAPELKNIPLSCAKKEVGYYIMRDGDNAVFINCGPIGTNGKGGHAHNDKLAFVLQLNALDFFVDPGIYVYTASRFYREMFRSTANHNTLQIQDWEQNSPGGKSVWWGMNDDAKCKLLEWSPFHFSGSHSGYCRYPGGPEHQRTIDWDTDKKQIRLTDVLSTSADGVVCNFVLHEDVMLISYSATKVVLRRENVLVTLTAQQGTWLTEGAFIAHAYGVKTYTQKLVLHWEPGTTCNIIDIHYENIGNVRNLVIESEV